MSDDARAEGRFLQTLFQNYFDDVIHQFVAHDSLVLLANLPVIKIVHSDVEIFKISRETQTISSSF